MNCDLCGQAGVQIRRISRSYGEGADLFVIENVPLVSCPHCGESYFTADTRHELERIKLRRRAMAQERHCRCRPCVTFDQLVPFGVTGRSTFIATVQSAGRI